MVVSTLCLHVCRGAIDNRPGLRGASLPRTPTHHVSRLCQLPLVLLLLRDVDLHLGRRQGHLLHKVQVGVTHQLAREVQEWLRGGGEEGGGG